MADGDGSSIKVDIIGDFSSNPVLGLNLIVKAKKSVTDLGSGSSTFGIGIDLKNFGIKSLLKTPLKKYIKKLKDKFLSRILPKTRHSVAIKINEAGVLKK